MDASSPPPPPPPPQRVPDAQPPPAGAPAGIRVAVRTRRLNAFCRKLAWCCGAADEVGGGLGLEPGEYVNVCLHVGMTRGAGDDMRALARETAKVTGATERPSLLVASFTCERREAARNKRGAVVLHATEYHGATATEVFDSDDEFDDAESHKEDKGQRHAVFAEWLAEVFGAERLAVGGGVLDVAAGKGLLSAELRAACGDNLACTLVEPASRGEAACCGSAASHACAGGSSTGTAVDEASFRWLEEPFDAQEFPERHSDVVAGCSALIGLHPDQATEAIVDCALKWRKPFAIVPCCVYPSLFPERRLGTGQGVVSYGGFLKYLKEKDRRIQSARLPFRGRNKVLYLLER